MEEEENEKIKNENRHLLYKILQSGFLPSKYSVIYTPKNCPAFDKEKMNNKRKKEELEKYKENYNLYSKIFKIKPYYNTKEILHNSDNFQRISKRIQKSIRRINPCLYFQSPSYIKDLIEKNKININRSNSVKQSLNKSTQESKKSKNNSSKNNSSKNLNKHKGGLQRSQICQNIFNKEM